jgi:hypothetical protein
MTRGQAYKKDLIQYRLESAREMLRDAQLLKENGGSPLALFIRGKKHETNIENPSPIPPPPNHEKHL